MQRRIFYLLFPIAGVLLFQSAQAQSIVFPPGPIVFPPGTATGTVTAGTYAGNINLDGTGIPTQPLSLTLESGVIVNRPSGNAVNAANITLQGPGNTPPSASVTITATDTTITNLATPSGNNQSGLRIQSSGAATITATNTNIDVNGTNTNNGIWAIVQGANVPPLAPVNATVTWTGDHITVIGTNSTGIQAENRGFGNASVDASGNISGNAGAPGNTLLGIKAGAGSTVTGSFGQTGDASVIYRSGTINLVGASFSAGIFATAPGSATITTLSGTSITVSQGFSADIAQEGIEAFATNGATLVTAASTILVNGNPTSPVADFRSQPKAIQVQSNSGGPAEVDYTGPGITVHGGGGLGIAAVSRSGSVTVNAFGGIVADGTDAVGILADSGTLRNAISGGLPPASITGPVQVTASNVSAPGQFGTAISANGGSGGVTVNIPSGGSIMGGWQATPFTPPSTSLLPGRPPASVTPAGNISSISGLPAAGIFLSANGGGTAILTNGGSIGALSDLAIAGDPQVTNNGTIIGFVQFAGDNNSITNNGTFDLRHFADTNGDGVRDTVRVAVADLGAGPNNSFTNNGTLALVQVTGATTLNSTGQYLPLGQASNTMALNGPLQGQLIGVATFTNSGTINLQANPVPGDVLMITGGRGGSTPGTGGGGTFITGGRLLLDTVLNEGGAATRSDTLVVDGTQVGPNGATTIGIKNAGGTGTLTVGDGILVVQVLDPARSAAGAFQLPPNQELRAGDFDYRLFHGGIGGSNPADWFLRNEFVVGPPVVPPVVPPETGLPADPPPRPLPPGVFPIIGPEIATYGVVQPLARQLGLAILGTLNDRVGDTYEPDGGVVAPAPATIPSGISKEGGKEVVAPPPPVAAAPCPFVFAPSVWSRFFAQGVDTHYRAFADPGASGNLWGFQLGVDLLRGSLIAGHYDRIGVYGAFGRVNSDVHGLVTNPPATAYSFTRTGSVSLNAGSAGGYWTHVGPGGWYLDLVLQGTGYFGSASTQFASLNTDGTGFIASLEGGAPLCWPQSWPQLGPGFVIEPQGQILWQKVSFRNGNDGLGDVALGDTTGPSGRIGLRTKWTIATAGGQVWQPYLRANLWRDWGADANTVFSGRDVAPLESQANVLEFGGGLTVRINANVSVYANADYEFAVGNTDDNKRNGVRGAFGARYSW